MLFLSLSAWAGPPMDSESNAVIRDVVDGGGGISSTSNNILTGSVSEEVVITTASTAANKIRAGWSELHSLPGGVADLAARSDVSVSSATLTWSSPGYDGDLGALQAGSAYYIRVASYTVPDTFSDHRSANISFSTSGVSPGSGVGAGATGLLANTTYWARLWAIDADGNVSYGSNISTFVTLAHPVTLQPESFLEVDYTSATVQWVARPSLAADVSSMTAEGYLVEASSTNFGVLSPGGIVSSSQTPEVTLSTLTVSAPSLVVDKDYYFRVASLNWRGDPNWTVLGTTTTLFQIQIPIPDDLPYTGIDTGTIVAHWDRNGNLLNSLYRAQVSTVADFSGTVTTTDTYNLFYSTGGLFADATYYFRVNATSRSATSDWAYLGSTSTWAHPPAAAAAAFPNVNISSLTVRWLHNGNPPDVSTYSVVATTEAGYPNNDAGNVVLGSTRPAGADPMATLASLSPDTSYYLFVDARNWSNASSGFVLIGSTATRPQPAAAAGFEEVDYSSAIVSWSTNGNPLGVTTFTVVLSTVAAYPPGGAWDVSAMTVPTDSVAILGISGLSLNTTYHLFVTAVGHSYSAFAAGASTATKASPPGTSPDAQTYQPIAADGFTLNWSSGTTDLGYNPVRTTYYALISLDSSFATASSSQTFNLSASFTGLSANTTYYARSAAYSNQSGTWTFTDFGSTSTLAVAPDTVATTFTAVEFTSMTVFWSRNGNPVNSTTYTVVLSPQTPYPNSDLNNVSFDTAPGGANPQATLTGLNTATTYYLFVRAVNNNGVPTAFSVLGSTRTKFSPKTWVGGADNNWYTAANWSPVGVPGPNDGVTIAPGANVSVAVYASSPSISFSSLTLGGPSGAFRAALTISTSLASAGSVLINKNAGLTQDSTQLMIINGDFTMMSGSSFTHTAESAVSVSSINIRVTGTFDLQQGSAINVVGKGYRGGPVDAVGFGPGGGGNNTANNKGGGGAGYGGEGGAGGAAPAGAGGVKYGSLAAPINMGSGGGGSGNTGVGGAGGGIVIIDAAAMVLNGVILSSGNAGQSVAAANPAGGGGGSGGGVFITAGNFSGSGSIDIRGGAGGSDTTGGNGGGGGGGRAAIIITGSGVSCAILVSTDGGAAGGTGAVAGTTGTFSATDLLTAPQNFAGGVLDATSISWSWDLANGATDYQIFSSTGGSMSPSLGSVSNYTTTGLAPNTTFSFYVQARACGSNSVNSFPTQTEVTLAAVPAAAVATFTAVNLSSMSVAWTANGNPVDVTTYTVVLTSSPAYPNTNQGNVSFSTLPAGASLAATFNGLDPNTTYYFYANARNHAGIETAYASLGGASTLALPPQPGAQQFLIITTESVTVAWAAMAQSPPNASSASCEGYILLASSNNFGALAPAGAPVFSSATASILASTLTVGSPATPLDLSNTYYFQVASLNWAGAPNYTQLQRLNFQITQSTDSMSFGLINPFVARSTVSTSSMVVTNIGNWPVTIALTASTATLPSSPWALSTSSGIDTAALMGVWYAGDLGPPAVGPAAADFATYLTTTALVSQESGNYASVSQNGYQLAPGDNITLWVQFFLPTTSSTAGPEKMRITAQPVYP